MSHVVRRGASLTDERSERNRDGRARRSQTARAWPRAAQHINEAAYFSVQTAQ